MELYKIRIFTFFLFTTLIFSGCKRNKLIYSSELDQEKSYKVILMCGQSNMVGLGDINYLNSNVLPNNITYFNFGYDTALKLFDKHFGPEIGISRILHEKLPNEEFLLIKYAVGGSSVTDWLTSEIDNSFKSDRNRQFPGLYNNMKKKVAEITNGYETETLAFIWIQGEEDSKYKALGKSYEKNLLNLINKLRKDFNNDLPIVFTENHLKSLKYPAIEDVKKSQYSINNKIENTYLILTSSIEKKSDDVHYSSKGLLKLGENIGNKLIEIIENK